MLKEEEMTTRRYTVVEKLMSRMDEWKGVIKNLGWVVACLHVQRSVVVLLGGGTASVLREWTAMLWGFIFWFLSFGGGRVEESIAGRFAFRLSLLCLRCAYTVI